MEFTSSEIQLLRHATLALVLVSIFAIVGGAAMLAPSGAWYIPAGTVLGVCSVWAWVYNHDSRESQVG